MSDTADIVARLRDAAWYNRKNGDDALMNDAADEIEALRQQLARWEGAAFKMIGMASIRERNREYLAAAALTPPDREALDG